MAENEKPNVDKLIRWLVFISLLAMCFWGFVYYMNLYLSDFDNFRWIDTTPIDKFMVLGPFISTSAVAVSWILWKKEKRQLSYTVSIILFILVMAIIMLILGFINLNTSPVFFGVSNLSKVSQVNINNNPPSHVSSVRLRLLSFLV
jgi:amino acid permease